MQGYAEELRAHGFEITSRWINGSHQVMLNGEALGPEREAMFESDHESMEQPRREFAGHDWDDLMAADMVISFTAAPAQAGEPGCQKLAAHAAVVRALDFVTGGRRLSTLARRQRVVASQPPSGPRIVPDHSG